MRLKINKKNKNNEAQSLTLLHAMKSEAPTRDDVMIKCDIIKVRLQLSSFNITPYYATPVCSEHLSSTSTLGSDESSYKTYPCMASE